MPGIDSAIQRMGTQAALAEAVGVTQQNVSTWKRKGHVPLLQAIKIEKVTGVSRHQLVSSIVARLIK